MAKVYGTARFTVRDDVDRAVQAIGEFVTYVKTNETGTELYLSFRDRDAPATFTHFMIFADEVAEQTHASSEAVQRFTGVLYPLCVEPVRFERFELVAGG